MKNMFERRAGRKIKSAFTLIELIIIVVIIGILATFAMPAYYNAQLKARDREAKAMLKLMQHAQKVYELEQDTYVDCADTDACNSTLRLDLPKQHWDYSVTGASTTDFCAQAIRQASGGGTQDWYISATMDEAGDACL